MHSCLYEGAVVHHRRRPVRRRFRYPLTLAWIDLGELDQLVGQGKVLSDRRRSLCAFRRQDHLSGQGDDLRSAVSSEVQRLGGDATEGPVRLLTQLRWFGHYFSPLNLYYLYDDLGRVSQLLAEVNNTPWGERHLYLLSNRNRVPSPVGLSFDHAKEMHVSPFMAMQARYRWRISEPGEMLRVALVNYGSQAGRFSACMTLGRRPLTRGAVVRTAAQRPFATAQVLSAIYYQAFLLWWSRCPYYPHPRKLRTSQ